MTYLNTLIYKSSITRISFTLMISKGYLVWMVRNSNILVRYTMEEKKTVQSIANFLNFPDTSEYIRKATLNPESVGEKLNWEKFKRWLMDGQK